MGYHIKYQVLQEFQSQMLTQIAEWKTQLANIQEALAGFAGELGMSGATADSIKNYIMEVHVPVLTAMQVLLDDYSGSLLEYADFYYILDDNLRAEFAQERLEELELAIGQQWGMQQTIHDDIAGALTGIGDIFSCCILSNADIEEGYEAARIFLSNLRITIGEYEEHSRKGRFDEMDGSMRQIMNVIDRHGSGINATITTYQKGSALQWSGYQPMLEQVAQQMNHLAVKKVAVETAVERYTDRQIRLEAEGRIEKGVWKVVIGTATVITALGSGANPVASGTSLVYGADFIVEGVQDIHYGAKGDITTTSWVPIRDEFFQGNHETYYALGGISSIYCSISGALKVQGVTKPTIGQFAKEGGRQLTSGVLGTGTAYIAKENGVDPTVASLLGMGVAGLTYGGIGKIGQVKGTGGAEKPKTNFEAEKPMFGNDWNDYFKQQYGNDAVEWVSETITDISRLKGTENYRAGALEHVLEGEINRRGQAVGYHYEGVPSQKGTIISGTESLPNSKGVYQAMVEVNGIIKQGNRGYSTFFPKDLAPQQIVNTINEAYINRTFVVGSMNTYKGIASNGIEITMYLDKSGKIISAFPNY